MTILNGKGSSARVRSIAGLVVAAATSFLMACGGSSSNGDDVVFAGTVNDQQSNQLARPVGGVSVCALGECSSTDASGQWSFAVSDEVFTGGDVLFSLSGAGLNAESVVQNLQPEAEEIIVDFLQLSPSSAQVVQVMQDGTVTLNSSSTVDASLDGLSESERACRLIKLSNIVITNTAGMITSANAPQACPQGVSNIIVVGNPGSYAFDYEVSSDLADVTVEPLSGSLQPGELKSHDGSYLCTQGDTFDTEINVQVTTFRPEGYPALSADDAASLCGPSANEGNLVDSTSFIVNITPAQ